MNNASNIDALKYWFKPVEKIFDDLSVYTLDADDVQRHRIFVESSRPASVLAIAHLDTVQTPKIHKITDKRIYGQGLDDRLGCMIAWNMAKDLGIDLLFTDHEESGYTTAKDHVCKGYNWVVEFDRMRDDVVTYDLSSEAFDAALSDFWTVGYGSYSDICDLNTTACCMNLGVGYNRAHAKDDYADFSIVGKQVRAFKKFYEEYHATPFEQDPLWGYSMVNDEESYGFSNDRNCYNDSWRHKAGCCDICGEFGALHVFGIEICNDCFHYALEESSIEEMR